MNGFSRLRTRFFLIGSVLATLIAVIAPRAYASATGMEPVSAFTISVGAGAGVSVGVEIPIPAGMLLHTITGNGRKIDEEHAEYSVMATPIGLLKGKVCNWRIDFVYKGENGREYMREHGQVVPECGGLLKHVEGHARPKTLPKFGKACAELWVNGKFRAAQCHNIIAASGF